MIKEHTDLNQLVCPEPPHSIQPIHPAFLCLSNPRELHRDSHPLQIVDVRKVVVRCYVAGDLTRSVMNLTCTYGDSRNQPRTSHLPPSCQTRSRTSCSAGPSEYWHIRRYPS